jgi:large subunit ribosomal protein L25
LVAAIPVVLRHLPEHHEGVLTQVRSEIEVSGFPAALPHEIAFDASRFVNVGDTVHVSDLTLPAGVAAVTPADELIALIAASRVEAPEVAEEIAEEAAPEAEAPVAATEPAESPGEETAES